MRRKQRRHGWTRSSPPRFSLYDLF
jgi:hypothetical protein